LRYIADNRFIRERFGFEQSPGPIPMEKLNIWGGSLGLGNPFAATGTRLFLSAAQRLQHFGQRYAVISTCAGGGLGAAILLENPNF
jgi:acetyl-CoA acetyltransferase